MEGIYNPKRYPLFLATILAAVMLLNIAFQNANAYTEGY